MNIGWHTLILNKNHKINIEEKLFEIDEYIKNDLPNLISKVDDYNSIDDDLEKD